MVDTWIVATAVTALLTLLPLELNQYSGRVLSFPAIWIVYLVFLLELALYAVLRLLIRLLETVCQNPRRRVLRRRRRAATTYQEWAQLSQDLDNSQPSRRRWAGDLGDWTAQHFSWEFFAQLIADLRLARERGDAAAAVAVLQQCLRKNVGGIFSKDLYAHLHTGQPKERVTEFVHEIVATLAWLAEREGLSPEEREAVRVLLDGTRATLGRPALCLSGGGMIGLYHLGVVRALHERDLLPAVISGASAGGLVAAFACTRTAEELARDLRPEVVQPRFVCCARPWPQRVRSLLQHGNMFDNEEWLDLVKWFTCGNTTFREAHRKTGRTLCITLSTTTKSAPPILLNHVSAPHVVIASAVVASAAMPGLLKPARLLAKTADGNVETLKEEYWDGSIAQDIPIAGLAEQLNCQFFVVSQCNPHVVPMSFEADGAPGHPNRWTHSRRGGHLLAGLELYLRLDMILKMDFLQQVGAVTNFTSKMITQITEGDTTVVPRVSLRDYLRIVEDPTPDDMQRYFQRGSIATYGSMAMMRLHWDIAHAVADCRKALFGKENKVEAADAHVPALASPKPPPQRRNGDSDRPLVGGQANGEEEIDDDDDDDSECWEPIVYNSRHSLLRGTLTRTRSSLVV